MSKLGVILAGGASSRFGTDKAAAILNGKSLLLHVCEGAAPQVDRLVINRNDTTEPYRSLGYEIMSDDWPGEGPLAGIVTALGYARARGFAQIVSFPCDTPIFPADLVRRLTDQLMAAKADCCMARHDGREQRALAIWNTTCTSALKAEFLAGMRRLGDVSGVITTTVADFADGFVNINTPDDLREAERRLASRTTP